MWHFQGFSKYEPVGSHASFSATFKGQVYTTTTWYKNQHVPSEGITSGNAAGYCILNSRNASASLTLLGKLIQIDLLVRTEAWLQIWPQTKDDDK